MVAAAKLQKGNPTFIALKQNDVLMSAIKKVFIDEGNCANQDDTSTSITGPGGRPYKGSFDDSAGAMAAAHLVEAAVAALGAGNELLAGTSPAAMAAVLFLVKQNQQRNAEPDKKAAKAGRDMNKSKKAKETAAEQQVELLKARVTDSKAFVRKIALQYHVDRARTLLTKSPLSPSLSLQAAWIKVTLTPERALGFVSKIVVDDLNCDRAELPAKIKAIIAGTPELSLLTGRLDKLVVNFARRFHDKRIKRRFGYAKYHSSSSGSSSSGSSSSSSSSSSSEAASAEAASAEAAENEALLQALIDDTGE